MVNIYFYRNEEDEESPVREYIMYGHHPDHIINQLLRSGIRTWQSIEDRIRLGQLEREALKSHFRFQFGLDRYPMLVENIDKVPTRIDTILDLSGISTQVFENIILFTLSLIGQMIRPQVTFFEYEGTMDTYWRAYQHLEFFHICCQQYPDGVISVRQGA